jgi:hypothetical protein
MSYVRHEQIVGRSRRSTVSAYAFAPPLALPTSLLKKIIHSYPLRFLLPCRSALRLPVLDTDAHSPHCSRTPHPPPLARAPSRAPPSPSRRARRSSRPTQARGWWRWCLRMPLVLDASGAHAPLAPTPTAVIERHMHPLPYVANIYF